MPSKGHIIGDGFVQEFLPLLRNGFIILRSILDILIERIEEAEKNKEADVRKEIYSSIIEALETEIANIQAQEGNTPTAKGKIEVIEAVISVLLKEVEALEKEKSKRHRRPQKVKID